MSYARSYQTHLRVFEPLAAHPEYDGMDVTDNRARLFAMRDADADRRLLGLPVNPVPAGMRDAPLFLPAGKVGDGIDRVCPMQEDVRSWLALEQLAEDWQDWSAAAMRMVLPERARRRAASAKTAWLQENADARVFTRTAAWEVPPTWLVAVVADQDMVGHEGDAVVVRTPILAASGRAEWAAEVLERRMPDDIITAKMRGLAEWLDDFDLNAVVELDYGGLTERIWPDDTPALVDHWIEAVDSGDDELAQSVRHHYAGRWNEVSALATSS
ncbi:hypothetical protein [Sediminivirga luteola]|nr:hypothetical protein [Sediminivirga luteola]MCI2266061.1 hypothetical protein [Sediminivirga luteola]